MKKTFLLTASLLMLTVVFIYAQHTDTGPTTPEGSVAAKESFDMMSGGIGLVIGAVVGFLVGRMGKSNS
jgi:hypothetical protein